MHLGAGRQGLLPGALDILAAPMIHAQPFGHTAEIGSGTFETIQVAGRFHQSHKRILRQVSRRFTAPQPMAEQLLQPGLVVVIQLTEGVSTAGMVSRRLG